MNKQWLQIVVLWSLALIFGLVALLNLQGEARYTAFAAIAASAIAIVSVEHLISAKAKDTIRQQVYVSAGVMAILGTLTVIGFAG